MLPLTQDAAHIFRITHIDNLPWIFANGLHCRSSAIFDPNYRNIGNVELIQKRTQRVVPVPPGGTLSDYVPFYFTSRSPMLLNIKTGRNVAQLPMSQIVVLSSALPRLSELGINFVFSDRHAYLVAAQFSNSLNDLDRIDWEILAHSDFKYDANDPEKMDRYQAEALVHLHLPTSALTGIVCCDKAQEQRVRDMAEQSGSAMPIGVRQNFYF